MSEREVQGKGWSWTTVPRVSSDGAARARTSVAVAVVLAVALGLGLVGWLGWRLVAGAGKPQAVVPPPVITQEEGQLVPLAPESGIELRLLGWQHSAGDAPSGGVPPSEEQASTSPAGDPGAASAVATVRNLDSAYTEFILDLAAVDERGTQILGFATAQVTDLSPGALGAFTAIIPDGIPEAARLGVANLWGRTAGDPQIHPINFAVAAGADGSGPRGPSAETEMPAELWTEAQVMAAASQFAASVAAMQRTCRAEPSLAGLVCLSRRNFPDYLLALPARQVITGRPFFHQQADPTGPPRAFELTAPVGGVACVGQRIDKQTSDQVAIVGSCSQRGLYPGNGNVQAAVPAVAQLPEVPTGVVRVSTPVGMGGLPGSPVAADGVFPTSARPMGIGDTVSLGALKVTVDGVQVGPSEVPGLPPPVGTYTLVTITVNNAGDADSELAGLNLQLVDAEGQSVDVATDGAGVPVGWPPQQAALPPGVSVSSTVAVDLGVDRTATAATFLETTTGAQVTVSLLPPPS